MVSPLFFLGAMVFFPKCDATFSVGIYEDLSKCDRDLEVLIAAGIPRHLFKILTSNDDIDLKPVTQYLKAVS
ncbi:MULTISPECIES: hypothetical protein [unclassified Microcoleus]|uniref:hypothetical protein n=1 Tax=unclassified Microcoleus TaxID=2642155 RepID=UPI002FD51D90